MSDLGTPRTLPIAASVVGGLFAAAAARSLPVGAGETLEQVVGGRNAYGLLVGLNLAAFGLAGPASAWLGSRWGWRRTAVPALVLCALALAAGASQRPLVVLIGLGPILGAAAGLVAVPLAVTVSGVLVTRRPGLVVGALTGASAVGQIAALPVIAGAVATWGRQASLVSFAGLCLLAAAILATAPAPTTTRRRSTDESVAARRPRGAIIALGAVFAACGATTTGIVGTHLVPAAHDHGVSAIAATSALAAMGALTLVGSLSSGWLSDRHDPRQILFALYVVRGISLFFLPFALQQGAVGIAAFVIVFGLDWAASIPPTVALTREVVGPARAGQVVGWLFVAHHAGAGLAAWAAGTTATLAGNYVLVFLCAGLMSVVAGIGAWAIPGGVRARRPAPVGSEVHALVR